MARPSGEIVRVAIDEDGRTYPDGVQIPPDFHVKVALASSSDQWRALNDLVWKWIPEETNQEIITGWRVLGRDPRVEGWRWFHGQRPECIATLAFALESGDWSPTLISMLREDLRNGTYEGHIESRRWFRESWPSTWSLDELAEGAHRQVDPWTGEKLPSPWELENPPAYKPSLMPIDVINGPWMFCLYQMSQRLQGIDTGAAAPPDVTSESALRGFRNRFKIHLTGQIDGVSSTVVWMNNIRIALPGVQFLLLLRLVIALHQTEDGYVPRGTQGQGGGLVDEDIYPPDSVDQATGNLRKSLSPALEELKGTDVIQVSHKQIRLSSHRWYVSFDSAALADHPNARIRSLAQQLP